MNQDFAISGSAGMCRRLVKLSKICNVEIDPKIAEIAQTNLLIEDDFKSFPDLNPAEKAAIQTIIDFNFRTIVLGHLFSAARTVLISATIAKLPIVVISNNRTVMAAQARKISFPMSQITFLNENAEINYISGKENEGIDIEAIKDKRHGILVSDMSYGFKNLAMLFEKVCLLGGTKQVSEVDAHIDMLFPLKPTYYKECGCSDIVTHQNNPQFRKAIERMGFKTSSPRDLAFLLNVTTDLLNERF